MPAGLCTAVVALFLISALGGSTTPIDGRLRGEREMAAEAWGDGGPLRES